MDFRLVTRGLPGFYFVRQNCIYEDAISVTNVRSPTAAVGEAFGSKVDSPTETVLRVGDDLVTHDIL